MDLSWNMVAQTPSLIAHHYKEGNLNWPMIIYISLVHVVAAVGAGKVMDCSKETLLWAFLLWPIRCVPVFDC